MSTTTEEAAGIIRSELPGGLLIADQIAARVLWRLRAAGFDIVRRPPGAAPPVTVPAPAVATPLPPSNCRERLRKEGQAYPRSGCVVCGSVIRPGWACPYEEDQA